MSYTKLIPLSDFVTSGGLLAEDQFVQDVQIAIPIAIEQCFQDFINATVVFASQLTGPQETTLAGIVAAHTAVGRLTVGPVATLPPGLFEGEEGYATDGRKVGEGVGAGTGVPIYWSVALWRVFSDDTEVQD